VMLQMARPGLQTTCTFTCPSVPASLASLTDWSRELLSEYRLVLSPEHVARIHLSKV
jgi:hypothetical protein